MIHSAGVVFNGPCKRLVAMAEIANIRVNLPELSVSELSLQATRRQFHQLWRGRDVPVGARRFDVAEVDGEGSDVGVDVSSCPLKIRGRVSISPPA